MEKLIIISNIYKHDFFFEKLFIIRFVNVETDPGLRYLERTRRLGQVSWVGLERHSC
jgi:hypothetical protein